MGEYDDFLHKETKGILISKRKQKTHIWKKEELFKFYLVSKSKKIHNRNLTYTETEEVQSGTMCKGHSKVLHTAHTQPLG